MKNLLALALSLSLLAACGGGGEEPAAVLTHVEPTATLQPVLPPVAPPSVPIPSVTPSVPVAGTTDVTLTEVAVNVKRKVVNVGEYAVNLAAFTAAFDSTRPNSSIQRLVFRNQKSGDSYQLFSAMRFVNADGVDVCNSTYSCYVDWGVGNVVTVYFTYGWRPTSELQAFALQGDVSTTAPAGAQFAFELIDVQMRQWQTSEDHSLITGGSLEVTTIVALPTVVTAIARQILGATAGVQYIVYKVSILCSSDTKTYCVFKRMKLSTEAENLYLGSGYAAVTPIFPYSHMVEINEYMSPGTVASWSFYGTATGSSVYTQAYDLVITVDGIDVAPKLAMPTTETVSVGGGRG